MESVKCVLILMILSLMYGSGETDKTDPIKFSDCDKSHLEKKFTGVSCIDKNNNGISTDGQMEPGTLCKVSCKSNDVSTYVTCSSKGIWQGYEDACGMRVRKHSRPKRWFRFIGRIFRAIGCLFVRCSRPRPRDRTPPTLKCPDDIHAVADPVQVNTKVYWVEPQAWDDKDGKVNTKRTGLAPGKLFSENRYNVIKYHARDRSGNLATCSFRITVTVTRCSPLKRVQNGYFICLPTIDTRRGSRCRFGCYEGHNLEGVSTTNCADTGRWTGWSLVQPYCKKKTCSPLIATPPLQRVTCSDSFNFRSICTFSCVDGYGIPASSPRVMVCSSNGSWKGQQPQCIDTSPPIFEASTCPSVVTFYTSPGSNTGQVYWPDPSAIDNEDAVIISAQTIGPTSGTTVPSGVYTVVYEAKDTAGNKAIDCVIKIVVKHILCSTIYPTPYTSVSCPAGTGYGENCQFDCNGGTVLNGTSSVTCERVGDPPYGMWSWTHQQPFCQFEEKCHELTPPANGALACDVWFGGRYCHPLCQTGYDVPRFNSFFPNLIVCGDTGEWSTPTDFSDCQVARGSRTSKTEIYFYYDGECSDESAQKEIKQNFIEALLDSAFKDYCVNTPECSYQNVMVYCGSAGRKRETRITLVLQINMTYTEDFTQGSYNDETNRLSAFVDTFKNETTLGKLDITLSSGGNISASYIKADNFELHCVNNTVATYPQIKCVTCGAGTYYSKINKTFADCKPCPRGYYQHLDSQDSCIPCPSGKSTREEKSVSILQCKDSCLPGTWSSTSLPPCSLCPVGTYQDKNGSVSCLSCQGGTTTQEEGATTVDKCKEFDIVLPTNDINSSSVITKRLSNDTRKIYSCFISFRMSCSGQCKGDVLNVYNEFDISMLNITLDGKWIINNQMFSSENGFDENTNQWHGYIIEVSPTSFSLYIDGVVKTEILITSNHTHAISNVLLGGNGFSGIISQFNIFTKENRDINYFRQMSSKCSNSEEGDLLSWSDVQKSDMKTAYIQLPSQCDDIDECQSSPCINGNCTDKLDAYSCDCLAGFTGDNCNINIDDCTVHLCQNNASCLDGIDTYRCNCKDSFTGNYCEITLVDGGWTDWGNWSDCSLSCGANATRFRERTCTNPSPDNGGQECLGSEREIDSCDMVECPTCNIDIINSKVEHGNFNCTRNETIDLYVCLLECDEGYDFDHAPPDNYKCGNATFYLWDFQTDDNPYGRLPQCVSIKNPTQINVTHSAVYEDLICSEENAQKTKLSVKNTVSAIANSLSCIASKTCSQGSIEVSNCEAKRRKRDTSSETAGFQLELLCDPETIGTIDCYSVLTTAINEILGMESAGELTTQIDSTDYLIQANSSTSNDELACPENTIAVYMYCVPCGKGRYYVNGECELCPVGTYQDEIQQSTCKNCSLGLSTNGTGSISVDDCNVEMDVVISSNTNVSEYITSLGNKEKIIIGTVIGTVVFTVLIVVGLVRLRKFLRHKSRLKTKGSLIDVNMVRTNRNMAFVFPDISLCPAKERFDTKRIQSDDEKY